MKMMTLGRSLAAALGLAVVAAGDPALAHHSFGMFDMQQNVTVTGTVKDYQWTNPHAWVDLLVVDPATNRTVPWGIEGDSISIMTRKGWTRNSVKPGDKVSIVVHPLKTGAIGGSLVSGTVNGQPIGHEWRPQ